MDTSSKHRRCDRMGASSKHRRCGRMGAVLGQCVIKNVGTARAATQKRAMGRAYTKSAQSVITTCRGSPLWLPNHRASTANRAYLSITLLSDIVLIGVELGEAFDIFDGTDAKEDIAILDHVGGCGVVVNIFVKVFGAIGVESSCASFNAEDIKSIEFADIGLRERFSVEASWGGDLGEGVAVAGELDQIEDGGPCDALGHACCEIAFGVNDFVSADETEDLGVEIAGCACDDVRDFEACDQSCGEDGTFNGLSADGNDDGVEVLDRKGMEVVFVGGVGANGAGDG